MQSEKTLNGAPDVVPDSKLVVELLGRLRHIEATLEQLVQRKTVKEWYCTAEAAEELQRAEWTVREYCRLGRINASKRACGRGRNKEWMISHEELKRIENEGLLPDPRLTQRRM